jgi:hypothetical protein
MPGLYNVCMKQLNLNVTPEFERDLKLFMKRKGIKRKSDAIRYAIREAASRTNVPKTDFRSWIGVAAKDAPNPNPRFKSEDDLWS